MKEVLFSTLWESNGEERYLAGIEITKEFKDFLTGIRVILSEYKGIEAVVPNIREFKKVADVGIYNQITENEFIDNLWEDLDEGGEKTESITESDFEELKRNDTEDDFTLLKCIVRGKSIVLSYTYNYNKDFEVTFTI